MGGPVEEYAEAFVSLGNCELTFASVFFQLKTVRPGLWGLSGLRTCIVYHLACDLGTLMNWSFLSPVLSCDLDGYPSSAVRLSLSSFWHSQSSGGMATETRVGFLGFFPFQGLLDLSGSAKVVSKVGMWCQPI